MRQAHDRRLAGHLAAAAEHGRTALRREVTAAHAKVERAIKCPGTHTDIGKIIGASRATVYRYLSLANDELL